MLSSPSSSAKTAAASGPSSPASPNYVSLTDKLEVSAPLLSLDAISTLQVYSSLRAQASANVVEIRQFEFSGVSLQNSKSTKKKPLPLVLRNCHGYTKPMEMLTVLGPNALAQTELLNLLAGRQHSVALLDDSSVASFTANESQPLFECMRAGFVTNNPKFQITCTVEEEFTFSAKLRLPIRISTQDLSELVNDVMAALNLTSKAKSQIRFLSKVEVKRVAIGVELLSMPNVLFVDQPLVDDRKEDWETIQMLQSLQCLGVCQVVVALFAPRDEIFQEVSQHFVLLDAQGNTLSVGGVDQAKHYFVSQGYTNPERLSVGDFFLLSAEYATTVDVVKLKDMPSMKALAVVNSIQPAALFTPVVSFDEQFMELLKRELLMVKRLPPKLISRFLSVAVIMGLCAVLFSHAGNQELPTYSAASHFSSFVFPILSMSFSAAMPTVIMLHEHKQIMLREQTMGGYWLTPALLAKLVSEVLTNFAVACEAVLILYWSIGWGGSFITIIAAFFMMMQMVLSFSYLFAFLCSSSGAAAGLVAFAMGPQLFFLGTFARYATMPSWLSWLSYVCNMSYTMRILSSIEFAPDKCSTPAICLSFVQTLASNYIDPDMLYAFFLIQLLFLIFYRLLACWVYGRVLERLQ
ncbi:hypothetical protein BASA81_002624 [Batrachochytrium salamandrivorans]|nr:hypothetical protein BASA81_002624 [Batrachochytrium salamandrivorans]